MAGVVRFFVEDIDFKLSGPRKHASWLKSVATHHGGMVGELNYIFVSDAFLLQMNQQFLKHDTLTDIITFPTEENRIDSLCGEIYISVERVVENAASFNTTFDNELDRVMAHGLLHLIGFKDKKKSDQKLMRAAEEHALSLR